MTETTKLWRPSERIRRPSGLVVAKVADDDARWKQLREQFPPYQIGHKPQPWCRACSDSPRKVCDAHTKKKCRVCGNNITEAHIDLDFVGHAAVTQRLLEVDPHWEWRWITKTELEEHNFPEVESGRWIWLFVLDQVRPGLGEVEGSQLRGANATKALMSDAIKNAAMRYGVAIETWSKEDLANERGVEAEKVDEARRAEEDEQKAPEIAGWLTRVEECKTQPELQKIYDAARRAKLYTGELKEAVLKRKGELERAEAAVPAATEPTQPQTDAPAATT